MAGKILITNIKKLAGIEKEGVLLKAGKAMSELESIDNAFLLIEDGKISAFGDAAKADQYVIDPDDCKIINARGGMVFPSFCDSHTHLVYAGSREIEYVDKIKGLSYEEIAKRGGGILNSAKRLHEATEEELTEDAMLRLNEMMALGTGAVEIKSGYGLNTEDELKMLRVIRKLQALSPLTIRATFLGAHAVPE
ncbi:MAG TPA: imidazolonepropionase, partial [Lentimicrobium sp.]|nr:imidazolonepropionase [Lentimicrobium sp.]